MLFRVRLAPSPIRLGRPLPVPPPRHGEAVERNSYAPTHARTHIHSLSLSLSLSFSRFLFCSFSHFLFLFAFRRPQTPSSYDEDSLRMERDFSLLVLSFEPARLRIHPSRDCSFIFLLLLQLRGRARFSYISLPRPVFSFYVFDRK